MQIYKMKERTESKLKTKIIGISTNIVTYTTKPFMGFQKSAVCLEYIKAVVSSGGIPMMVPITTDENIISKQVELLDGLILTGGDDINPLRFGEEPSAKIHEISMLRDEYEFLLVKKATEKGIPILGICRGHQLLNVFNGGTLYQDLSDEKGSYIKHFEESNPTVGYHTVNIKSGTMLFGILGETSMVNSYHHIGIKNVAKGFEVSAIAKDDVIEAIERKNPFAMGIQWHPEMMQGNNKEMKSIFEYFIEKC